MKPQHTSSPSLGRRSGAKLVKGKPMANKPHPTRSTSLHLVNKYILQASQNPNNFQSRGTAALRKLSTVKDGSINGNCSPRAREVAGFHPSEIRVCTVFCNTVQSCGGLYCFVFALEACLFLWNIQLGSLCNQS